MEVTVLQPARARHQVQLLLVTIIFISILVPQTTTVNTLQLPGKRQSQWDEDELNSLPVGRFHIHLQDTLKS